MFKSMIFFIFATFVSGAAFAHPSVQAHAHPHDSAASFMTVESVMILAIALTFGLAVSYFFGRRSGGK